MLARDLLCLSAFPPQYGPGFDARSVACNIVGIKLSERMLFLIISECTTGKLDRFRIGIHLNHRSTTLCPPGLPLAIFVNFMFTLKIAQVDRDSSVGVVTCYGLDGTGIESRWCEIFRTRPERSWGSPSLLYSGYRVFPWGKTAGAWC
jgi:hypothetical protein